MSAFFLERTPLFAHWVVAAVELEVPEPAHSFLPCDVLVGDSLVGGLFLAVFVVAIVVDDDSVSGRERE